MPRQPPHDDWQDRWDAQAAATLPPLQPMPNTKATRGLARVLLPDEVVLAWAEGKGHTLLVATDRRVIVAKVGVAATARWFGKTIVSFAYGQIGSVDLHAGLADGYVQILSVGQVPAVTLGRYAQLVHADNVCPFARAQEGAVRRVVAVISERLYPAASGR